MIYLQISSWIALAVVLLALAALWFQYADKPRGVKVIEHICGFLMLPVIVLFVIGCVVVAF